MGILSEFRQNLFINPEPLKANNKYKENKWRIDANIPYDEKVHWIIYDFINEKIFRKNITKELLEKDTEENVYKNEDGQAIEFDMKEYIEKYSSQTMLEYQIPEGKTVLCLFPDNEFSKENIDEIFYNTLHTTMQKRICKKSIEQISKIEYTLNNKFHWLWFRLDGAKISKKIITRASSWIKMNPELEFHLWTNLRTEEDVGDFFAGVKDHPDFKDVFSKNVQIHYYDEIWSLTREFCQGLKNTNNGLNIWGNLVEIINNVQDRASMIFKTDVVRCIILYMLGGWYADFNDTYCFVSLKYIIHPDQKEFVYMGSDYNHRHNNNYIMYSPQGHEVWLNNILKLMVFSFKIHKILEIKDEKYAIFVRAIIKTLAGIAEKSKGGYLFDEMSKRLNNWITLMNKETAEMLERNDIKLPISLDVKMNEFFLFIKYILNRENPHSPLVKRYNYEMGYVKSVAKIENSYKLFWREKPTDGYEPEEDDIKFWKEFNVSRGSIYNTLLQVNLKNMIYMTNMGTFFASEKMTEYVYSIPYCYVHENFTFISALGHVGDGTCTGNVKDYNHNYL
jgi:hypothetical protein